MNDGAAACCSSPTAGAGRAGGRPLARIAAQGNERASSRSRYGIGPVEAARDGTAAGRHLEWGDSTSVELNEAFAAQSLACLRELARPRSRPIVNPLGGAIAIGHPLGAPGARILTTLVHHLRRDAGGR